MDGNLSVEGATVTFTPSAPWALLADYEIEVAATVSAADAGELGASYEFGFQSRDGVFRKPERLTATAAYLKAVAGNRAGHVAVAWTDQLTPASSYVALFDPQAGEWGKTTALEADAVNDYSSVSVGLNESGQVFAITGGNTVAIWNRAVGGKWGTAKTTGLAQPRHCVLADDGTAMTMWEGIVGNDWKVFAAALSPSDQWSATTTLGTKARRWALVRYDSGYLALFSHEPDYQVFYRTADAAGTWAPEQPLTPAGVAANYTAIDTERSTALFAWSDPAGRVQASLFDGTAWTTEDLGPVLGDKNASIGPTGHLVTWIYEQNEYAAWYDLETGWDAPTKLGPTSTQEIGPAVEVDPAGNALAAWPDQTHIVWRRFSHATSVWTEAQAIKDQDPDWVVESTSDASGNVMLVWSNPLGVWATRFE